MWQQKPSKRIVFLLVSLAFLVATGCATSQKAKNLQPDPAQLTRTVADQVLEDYPEPPKFDWGEGVLMAGMMHAGITLDEPRYIEFVREWADYWDEQGLEKILAGGPTAEIQKYCGHWGPGYPVLLLYKETGNKKYLRMAETIGRFIMHEATRTEEGGLGHWGGNIELWVDTLYMVTPLFAGLYEITGERAYLSDAVDQLKIYARRTQDEKTGLFWHMYDAEDGQLKGVLWARGNGWVAMSYVEIMQAMQRNSPDFQTLLVDFRQLIKGLIATWNRDQHLWHTIMDRPDTYLETSASAMILSSLVKAEKLDLVTLQNDQLIYKTWSALAKKVDDEGHVTDVSGGTIPDDAEVYAQKITGTYTWGTGAFLMASCAMEEMKKD
jgi:unsaturated rhamnogalacturonyl hydrolase